MNNGTEVTAQKHLNKTQRSAFLHTGRQELCPLRLYFPGERGPTSRPLQAPAPGFLRFLIFFSYKNFQLNEGNDSVAVIHSYVPITHLGEGLANSRSSLRSWMGR